MELSLISQGAGSSVFSTEGERWIKQPVKAEFLLLCVVVVLQITLISGLLEQTSSAATVLYLRQAGSQRCFAGFLPFLFSLILERDRAVDLVNLFKVHNMCTALGGASPALLTASHCYR